MAEFIVGRTANEVWRKAADKLLHQKNTVDGRTGKVFEMLHSFISIEEPRQKWVYDCIPPPCWHWLRFGRIGVDYEW